MGLVTPGGTLSRRTRGQQRRVPAPGLDGDAGRRRGGRASGAASRPVPEGEGLSRGHRGRRLQRAISRLDPLDAAGRALRPAILYSDQRSVRQLEWLCEKIGADEMFRVCGNAPSVGTCSLTSLLWLKENEPAVFEQARFFAHANSYLAARLTGVVGMDWTNAALTGCSRPARRSPGRSAWRQRPASPWPSCPPSCRPMPSWAG